MENFLQEFKRGTENAEINYISFDNLGILLVLQVIEGLFLFGLLKIQL